MSASLQIRRLTRQDVAFADTVRALAGWNQTLADWERFLTTEPDGCFLAEWHGAAAGTATTITYGDALAWIGMVLVHPGFRRRGIGRALLERCIEHLRLRGVRCIKLDATPAGKPVYDRLGFKEEWALTRWECAAPPGFARDSAPGVRDCCNADTIDLIDSAAFGVSRRSLLSALMKQSLCTLSSESGPGAINGYGMLRSGSSATYLGPMVATSVNVSARLFDALLARAAGRKIYWDIPDGNTPAVEAAVNLGFLRQRALTRMYLGENTTPGDPQRQFAIAGPELG